jgi:hypothetical protein
MKVNQIKVGSEVNINGRWAVVDEIVDGIAYCLDQDGGGIEIAVGNIGIITK